MATYCSNNTSINYAWLLCKAALLTVSRPRYDVAMSDEVKAPTTRSLLLSASSCIFHILLCYYARGGQKRPQTAPAREHELGIGASSIITTI